MAKPPTSMSAQESATAVRTLNLLQLLTALSRGSAIAERTIEPDQRSLMACLLQRLERRRQHLLPSPSRALRVLRASHEPHGAPQSRETPDTTTLCRCCRQTISRRPH